MEKNIGILLPTYNSEKYLVQQIESLIAQSYSNWHLWVRDDGSIDATMSILREFQQCLNSKITIIADNKGQLGPCKSFEVLMRFCTSQYLMFCDHDDVWLPNKIEETMKSMLATESKFNNLPVLICTDLQVVDENLNIINTSLWNYMRNKPTHTHDLYDLAVSNYVTGCTVLINRMAVDCSLPFNSKTFMHDWWIALNVCKNGIIVALPQSTILYRQHTANTLGTKIVDIRYFLKRIISIRYILKNNKEIYEMFKSIHPHFSLALYVFKKIKVVLRKLFFRFV